jgi:hypothetical protein
MHYDSRGRFGALAVSCLLACSSSSPGEDGDSTQGETGDTSATGPSGTSGSMGSSESSSSGVDNTGVDTAETDDTEGASQFDVWELRAGGFQPPTVETWYSCYSFQIEADQLHHIVGFEAQVTSPMVHHYVLSLSNQPVNLDPAQSCISWPSQILWAWAPGIDSQMLPEEAGFRVGDAPGGIVTFVLQVHYNNPLQQQFTDDDGIDVIVTKDLRPHDAGIFSQGDIASLAIPPGNANYEHVATCSGAQTTNLLPNEIHVFATFLHMHEIGAGIFADVWRDGAPVGSIGVDDPFDFNTQKFMPADIDIAPGDSIQTHCIFDSSERDNVTLGGVGSLDEMCINFMMYYPKVAAEKCGSF